MVQCGACRGICEIRFVKEECAQHRHDGYLDPSCCVSKVTNMIPSTVFFYFAMALTSYIISAGFVILAPFVLPPPTDVLGLFLWSFSIYASLTVAYNFRMGATTDPGDPATVDDARGILACSAEGGVVVVKDLCTTCQCSKPPRCHHCSTCNR